MRSNTTIFYTMTLAAIFFVMAYLNHRHNQNLLQQQITQEVNILKNKALKAVNTDHLRCLATNIYHEAGSEPFMGQVAVARVVMNRIKYGFASNPCTVTYQKTNVPDLNDPDGVRTVCQFSWVCENKATPSKNNPIYKQAEQIAFKVLSENKWNDVIPNNVLFFHNSNVDPNWKYKQFMTIGNHVFYGKEKTHK